jgi:hypothetical protein
MKKVIIVFTLLLIMTFLPGPKSSNILWILPVLSGYIGILLCVFSIQEFIKFKMSNKYQNK